MIYIATVVLHRSEDEFWRMTPRKFFGLVEAHKTFNEPPEKKTKKGFIDEVM